MNKGFSLIEVIITLVVAAIVGVFTFSFLGSNIGSYMLMRDRRIVHQEAATALERITREVRDAGDAPSWSANTLCIQRAHGTGIDANLWVSFCNDGSRIRRHSGASVSSCSSCSTGGIPLAGGTLSVTQQTEGWKLTLQFSSGGQTLAYQSLISPKNRSYLSTGCVNADGEFCGRSFGGYYEDKIQ